MNNCVIIGAGNKGAFSDSINTNNSYKYLSFSHAIQDNPCMNNLGYIDINEEKVNKANKLWRNGQKNAFNHNNVDIVFITTPDNTHFDSFITALSYEPKVIFMEKPVPINIEEQERILSLLKLLRKAHNKICPMVFVGYTRRYTKKWQEIQQDIINNKYGEFKYGYLYYNRGKYHTASHFSDIVNYFNIKDLKKIKVTEISENYRWVFDWALFFENDFVSEHAVDIKTKTVSIYDNYTKDVLTNIQDYLLHSKQPICTFDEGVKAIKTLEKFDIEVI